MDVDYLIIGQGLAGSALAIALSDLGATVLVVDSGDEDSASKVAAGLITTVAGKGMNLSWRQSEYLPEALEYYSRFEALSGEKLFYPVETLRLFDDEKQKLKFQSKVESLDGWVKEPANEDFIGWKADHGGFIMERGGRLDTRLYLQVIREFLGERYYEGEFNEADLEITTGGVRWKNVTAKKLILCQGARGFTEGGLFSDLPHRSAKGEILTVSIPNTNQDKIINRNGWMIPIGGDLWRCGATYEWRELSGDKTDVGKRAVEQKIKDLTGAPFKLVEHSVGIRPILRKSQPFIGYHSDHPEVGFFNGLGSKGVTTAPSVAAHFAQHLVNGVKIDSELVL